MGVVVEASGALFLAMMDGGAYVAPLGQQLIDAAEHGTIEGVGALLDQGVAVDSRDGGQYTPLIWACYRGHRAVVTLLLDRGANVNVGVSEDTPQQYWLPRAATSTPCSYSSRGGRTSITETTVDPRPCSSRL